MCQSHTTLRHFFDRSIMDIGSDGEEAEVHAAPSDIAPDEAGAVSCAEGSDDSYDENDTTMFHDAYFDAEPVTDTNVLTENSIPVVSVETTKGTDAVTSGVPAGRGNPMGEDAAQRPRADFASSAGGWTEMELCEHIMDSLRDSQLREWTTRRVFTEISRKRKRNWMPVEEKQVMDQVRRRITEMLESRVTVDGTYFTDNGNNTRNDTRDDVSELSVEEVALGDELSDVPDSRNYASRPSVPEQSHPSEARGERRRSSHRHSVREQVYLSENFVAEERSSPSRRSTQEHYHPSRAFAAERRCLPTISSVRKQGCPSETFVAEHGSSPSRSSTQEHYRAGHAFADERRSFPIIASAREQGYPSKTFVTEQECPPSRPSEQQRGYPTRTFVAEHQSFRNISYACDQAYPSETFVAEQESYPSTPFDQQRGYLDCAFIAERRSFPGRPLARQRGYPSETYVAEQESYSSRPSVRQHYDPSETFVAEPDERSAWEDCHSSQAFVAEQRSFTGRQYVQEPRGHPNRVPHLEPRSFTNKRLETHQRGSADRLSRWHPVAESAPVVYAECNSKVLAVLRKAATNLTAREIAAELHCDVKDVGYELRSLKKAGFGISLGPTKGWLAADHPGVVIRKPARQRSTIRPNHSQRVRGYARPTNIRRVEIPGSPSRKSDENNGNNVMNNWNAGSCSVSDTDGGQSHRQSIASSMDERKHPLECGDIFSEVYNAGDEGRNAKKAGLLRCTVLVVQCSQAY